MDLTGLLLPLTRPHPLVVPAPGGTRARLAVERAVRERGWPAAAAPAEADLVVACGPFGPGLAAALERVWQQVPAPRARVEVTLAEEAGVALAAGRSRLLDAAVQRADAAAGRADPAGSSGHGHGNGHERGGQPQGHDGGHGGGGHGGGGHGDGHGDSGHGDGHDRGHGSGGGHGHGGHGDGMGMPAGLAMADRAPDRDGLKLDQLHVPLGPVLPDWPAGLVLHTVLQGDVVQDAQVEVLGDVAAEHDSTAASLAFWDEPWLRALAGERVTRGAAARRRAAAHLDSLGRLLGVAGWADAALAARRLRDDLLAGLAPAAAARRLTRLARRLRRSRTLRWLTDRLGMLDPHLAAASGLGGPAGRAAGDVTARWTGWLEGTAAALEAAGDDRPLSGEEAWEGPRGLLGRGSAPTRALLELLPDLVVGTELAGARLIVASLDPDTDELVGAHAREARHG